MRKETLMKKLVSAVVTSAMVASLVVVNPTQAEAATEVALAPWSFFQTGATTDAWNAWELCAFSGVTFGDGVAALTEADFPHGDRANGVASGAEATATAAGVSSSFNATIESNGWSAQYGANDKASYNEPYTLRAYMDGFKLEYAHKYTVTFKASIQDGAKVDDTATDSKLAKISIADNDTNVWAAETIKITKEAKEYTYTFTVNNDLAKSGVFTMMLGAFPIKYTPDTFVKDFITPVEDTGEVNWSGTVSIADFKIVDEGLQEMPKDPEAQDPDAQKPGVQNPSNPSTPEVKAPAKAKISKVYTKKKASKKLKVKVKKVSGAAGYQFQVSKKSSFKSKNLLIKAKNTTKTTYNLSSSKLKNKKKLYVRVRAYAKKANGEKVYGAWSKSKKAKIK